MFLKRDTYLLVNQVSTGFIDVPGQISMNIYVQGCKHCCPGCHNPDLQSFCGGSKICIKDIDKLVSEYGLCKWVCWLGGDAIYQPDAFKEFNKEFKKYNLDICLYTGSYIQDIKDLINDVDLVIDGPWKGIPVTEEGSNQKIWIRGKDGSWDSVLSWKKLLGENDACTPII